ncbi:FAD-dependent monooxygenase [Actinoplanes sp. NPDC023714]|uniref:FAD-dependent monooxygenase n=1 Tax=Actinoplanes sp. NPDC023714 TaxID=3154322 RepID=UPI0033DD932F
MTDRPDLLVAGAGPTGLALALYAHDHGASVRIVERRPAAFRPSRALLVHARTLEVLRPLGITGELLDRADVTPHARLRIGPRVVPVTLGGFGWDDTAYPYLAVLRQADVEAVLTRALAGRGVDVERGTELAGVEATDAPDHDPVVTLRRDHGGERVTCRFLAGCDGADSTVRRRLGIAWRGADYPVEVVLADLRLDGDLTPGALHVMIGRDGLLFLFAAGERAPWRLLATRPAQPGPAPPGHCGPPVPAEELRALIAAAGFAITVTQPIWSTRIRIQRRLAGAYRHGRVLLAGDAAHTHSPAGGQGMNTGLQDAANLGWKLAFAPAAARPDELLDSYQRERRPIARQISALTHLLFWGEASTGPLAGWLRGTIGPLLAPMVPCALHARWPLAAAARVLSQLDAVYPAGLVACDDPPVPHRGVRAGARLPQATVTCAGGPALLHDLIAGPGLHLLLDRDADGGTLLSSRVHAHRLTDRPGPDVRVARPDGYLGYRSAVADPRRLRAWLAGVGAAPA